jgi:ADP-ribosylglycohydrolase
MTGAIAGDIIGSVYEGRPIKSKDFPLFSQKCRFTDDSVLSIALADAIMTSQSYDRLMREYHRRYPRAGYGGMFRKWALDPASGPYNSFGNGSAMRISPVGFAFDTLEDVLEKAMHYTEITHNHPEGIKGAQATAAAVFLARTGSSKEEIRGYVESRFGYDLSRTMEEIRPGYRFDVTCGGACRKPSLPFWNPPVTKTPYGAPYPWAGQQNTQACITGGIAQAFYGGIPEHIESKALEILDAPLRSVVERFMQRYVHR